jgi:hypothetical protein
VKLCPTTRRLDIYDPDNRRWATTTPNRQPQTPGPPASQQPRARSETGSRRSNDSRRLENEEPARC